MCEGKFPLRGRDRACRSLEVSLEMPNFSREVGHKLWAEKVGQRERSKGSKKKERACRMAEREHVRVKREHPDEAAVASTEELSKIWEVPNEDAIALDNGVAPKLIVDMSETVKADGEPAEGSSFWLGKRVHVEGKAGMGCVHFVGKTAFADGLWFGIVMEEAVGKHDGIVDGVRYFRCHPRHGLLIPSHCGKVKTVERATAERVAAERAAAHQAATEQAVAAERAALHIRPAKAVKLDHEQHRPRTMNNAQRLQACAEVCAPNE